MLNASQNTGRTVTPHRKVEVRARRGPLDYPMHTGPYNIFTSALSDRILNGPNDSASTISLGGYSTALEIPEFRSYSSDHTKPKLSSEQYHPVTVVNLS